MSEADEYRRGRDVEAGARQYEVSPTYRPVVPVVWGVGALLAFVTTLFSGFPVTTLMVITVAHIFLAGLIRGDINSMRRQGVEWGASRHVWFAAALVFPLVAVAYYVYSGRVLRQANAARTPLGANATTAAEAADTAPNDATTEGE